MSRTADIVFVCIVLVVLMIAAGNLIYSSNAAPPVPACVSDEDRVHIRALVVEAVDIAFKLNMQNLFTGWIKDPHQQPERASAGLQASIVAYQRARADALKWSPTSC